MLWRDIRFGFRTLIKSPAFTAAAVLSLALGLGVNTTIFTVVNTLFLNPLPVDHASELLAVFTTDANNTSSPLSNLLQVSFPNYKDFRDANSSFSSLAAYTFPSPLSLADGGEPSQVFVEMVTGNYFETLGVKPAAGRFFGPDEDKVPGAAPVLVLSYTCWQRQFGAANVLGRKVTMNGTPFTITGVAPDGFHGVNSIFSPDAWAPTMMYGAILPSAFSGWMDERRALLFNVAGRLKPGVSPMQAASNLAAIAKHLEDAYPQPNRGRSIVVRPLTEATIFPGVRDALLLGGTVLMVIVGLVLLIACSNVANLLLARATGRSQEIAVRLALGASRSQLVRQLVTESALLGLMGAGVALLVAEWSLRLILAARPPIVGQNFIDFRLDSHVLLYTFGLALVTSLIFGLAPALKASSSTVAGALKDHTRGTGRRRDQFGFANLLIIAQVALSLVALITAALFLRSSQAAARIDPGFDTEHVIVMTLSPGQIGYDQGRGEQFYRRLAEKVRTVPGVKSISFATNLPLFGFVRRSVLIEGSDPSKSPPLTNVDVVDTGYFDTAGIGLLRGRDFTDADRAGALPVAIVNEAMARQFWPGQEALGKRFRFYTETVPREVVGVVKTSKYTTLGEPPQPAAYTPLQQTYSDNIVLFVKAAGDAAALIEPVRREVRQLDPRMPIQNAQVVRGLIDQSLWAVNLAAALLGIFGALALSLACVGLYGVMSYSVSQRTREIGLRMALGASRPTVVALVMRQGLTLVGFGVIFGVGTAMTTSKMVASLLYGSSTDFVSYFAASVALVVVAALASLVPAMRASRVDPIIALRDA